MLTAEIESAMNVRIDISSYELLTNPGHALSRGKSTTLPNSARIVYIALIAAGLAGMALCQEISQIEPTQAYPHPSPESSDASEHESRHILGVIPNYKTSRNFDHYEPLTSREKFKIASEDSLDPGTFGLSAVFGGLRPGDGREINRSARVQQGSAGILEPLMGISLSAITCQRRFFHPFSTKTLDTSAEAPEVGSPGSATPSFPSLSYP